ncbi:MAG: hypothetical protein EPO35_03660 [Acidobacteria bacterium]|nr:MAG: hypothetical protein EPO35_03660 [Acidobacteriota bacterium]
MIPRRVVALGASNLTRAIYTVVSTARSAWTRDLEFVAALGLGRSYGVKSSVFGRAVPGILESGLWAQLDAMPAAPTIGFITDVGNDIMYNIDVPQILDWVREAASRLERHASAIVICGLPVEGERRLTSWQYRWLRYVLVPSCRLTQDELQRRATLVNAGLRAIAAERGHRFVELDSEWYGFDPIHIRYPYWRSAWSKILGVADARWKGSVPEAIGLYARRPQREWLFGVELRQNRQGRRLAGGGRVWLY